MEKRVRFKGILLPLLLVMPQIVVTAVFFFYPAGQAIWQRFCEAIGQAKRIWLFMWEQAPEDSGRKPLQEMRERHGSPWEQN